MKAIRCHSCRKNHPIHPYRGCANLDSGTPVCCPKCGGAAHVLQVGGWRIHVAAFVANLLAWISNPRVCWQARRALKRRQKNRVGTFIGYANDGGARVRFDGEAQHTWDFITSRETTSAIQRHLDRSDGRVMMIRGMRVGSADLEMRRDGLWAANMRYHRPWYLHLLFWIFRPLDSTRYPHISPVLSQPDTPKWGSPAEQLRRANRLHRRAQRFESAFHTVTLDVLRLEEKSANAWEEAQRLQGVVDELTLKNEDQHRNYLALVKTQRRLENALFGLRMHVPPQPSGTTRCGQCPHVTAGEDQDFCGLHAQLLVFVGSENGSYVRLPICRDRP
jgi:hypothetical protein